MQGETQLYVIRDKVSGLAVSNLIPALNEGVAMNGFRNYVHDEEKNGLNKAMYELCFVGFLYPDGSIESIGDDVRVLCTGENVEQSFDDWCKVTLAKEEAEE